MNLNVIERRLKREHGLPENFEFWRWECFPKMAETIYIEFEGGEIQAKFKSGPRKGRPNYRTAINRRTFAVTIDKGAEWERDYVAETGNCLTCTGTGQEWRGWNRETGNKYRPCGKCQATGKALVCTP